MTKIIVRFLNLVLNITAIIFIIGGGVFGFASFYYADNLEVVPDEGALVFVGIIGAIFGAIAGFVLSIIVLGIPLLLLRINQNLEEINASLQSD